MDRPLLQSLTPYLWRYRRAIGLGMGILIANVCVFASIPYVLKLAIDGLRRGISERELLVFPALLMALVLARAGLQYLQRLILINTSRNIEYDIRNDLLRHLETLPRSWYQRMRTGEIMARATNDLSAVRNMFGPGLMYSANALALFAVVVTIMLRLDARLTLLVFLPAPFVMLAVQWFGKRIHERFERIQSMFASLATKVEENLAGLRIVRAYAREDREIADFDELNRDYIRRNLRLVLLSGAFDPLLQALLGLAFLLVLWFGGRAALRGQITLGDFVAFNAYMMQMSFPMIAMGWVINLVQRGLASWARMREILRAPAEIADGPGCDRSIRTLRGEAEFRQLSFSFEGREVLHDIELAIPAGGSLAIVGPTGAGKSTLAALLPRLYEAAPGMVRIDGRPIAEIPLAVLRAHIGLVPQETFLFSDTLHNNIAFGVPDATEAAVLEAAVKAGLGPDLENFPEGLKTGVGERGLTLSGGQKQRVAIARALIRDPRILILDDALSAVDTLTEETILNNLRQIMQGRTTIFISHRISTLRGADQIIVLDHGRILERGDHATLIGLGGHYASLYEKQLLEEELQAVS